MIWQTIEKAPKDGSAVLLYCPSLGCDWPRLKGMPNIVSGIWSDELMHWVSDVAEASINGFDEDACSSLDHIRIDPTHWMPLPEIP